MKKTFSVNLRPPRAPICTHTHKENVELENYLRIYRLNSNRHKAQLVEFLPSMQETLSLNPIYIKLGVMIYARRQGQGNQNFKVIASYIVNLKPV